MVERIVASGGHTHLMLAGSPRILARVRKALPKNLERILVDTIPASARDRSTDIVLATLSTFVEHEERESSAVVDLLRRELRRGGLAVHGYRDSLDALEHGQADLLIMLADRDDMDVAHTEELVRLAVLNDVHVEVVQHSDELAELGGVGCLLRYQSWAPALVTADHTA